MKSMQLSQLMLYTALLYLPAGEPGADQLERRIQELMRPLKNYTDTIAAEQTGLLESHLFLVMLCHLAYRTDYILVRRQAAACLRAVAKSRGFTRQQLEDQLVLDCGLNGGMV